MSDKSSVFLYTYVSDSPEEYKNRFKEVFGLSPVFKKISFDGEAFNTSLIRGVGFIFKDLKEFEGVSFRIILALPNLFPIAGAFRIL
jgi:hypothetical protein